MYKFFFITSLLASSLFGFDLPEQVKANCSLVPVLIAGSGAAGLSAAIYTSRAKLYTVVVTGKEPGGQLMGSTRVENMPGTPPAPGYIIIEKIEQHAINSGAKFLDDSIERIEQRNGYFEVTTEQGRVLHALTLIIATGASAKYLRVAGESVYLNQSIFTCAVCDCRQATDKRVLVVGGGDSAIETVMHVAPYASSITVAVRGDQMRAAAVMQDKLRAYKHVNVLYNHEVVEFRGDIAGNWQGVLLRNNKTDERSSHAFDCVFLAIGHTPNSSIVKQLVPVDEQGYILLEGRTQRTKRPGILAAGDVADHEYRQAEVARADGVKAGMDAINELHQRGFSSEIAQQLEPYYFKDVR